MAAPTHYLAQVNVARLAAPLDSPQLAPFVALLDSINALADRSPGFVWRLQTESGNATELRPFDDDRIIVNLSVWTDLGALKAYVYTGEHAQVMRRRRDWFLPFGGPYMALWWLIADQRPTPQEARARLDLLHERGPSPEAFTFSYPFPPPPTAARLRSFG
jgi:hypothetical protein